MNLGCDHAIKLTTFFILFPGSKSFVELAKMFSSPGGGGGNKDDSSEDPTSILRVLGDFQVQISTLRT